MDANEIVEKIKALVKEGNVTRLRILRGDNIILNLPMTVGVAGGVIGLVVIRLRSLFLLTLALFPTPLWAFSPLIIKKGEKFL